MWHNSSKLLFDNAASASSETARQRTRCNLHQGEDEELTHVQKMLLPDANADINGAVKKDVQ